MTVQNAPVISAITANKTTAGVGEKITWTVSASGGTGALQYCYYVYNGTNRVYAGSYISASTFSYKPTAAGTYKIRAFVKDSAGSSVYKDGGEVTVTAASAPQGTHPNSRH